MLVPGTHKIASDIPPFSIIMQYINTTVGQSFWGGNLLKSDGGTQKV
jgi:hypothetical protein